MMDISSYYEALKLGNLETVKQALEDHPEWSNIRNDKGFTPLIWATYAHQTEVAKQLLDNGAAIDDKDSAGNTALMGVCFKGYRDVVQMLLEAGASLNDQNVMGATALIYAVQFGHIEIAKDLLKAGADSTLKDNKGNTAKNHAENKENPALLALIEEYKNL